MSGSRVALANSTNLFRPSSRFIPKTHSRKSPPTCTISLANVSSNDLCIDISSISSSSATPSVTNFIPFPTVSPDLEGNAISQPDRTCLTLLRSSPTLPSHTRVRTSPVVQTTQDRRKRPTARLLEPMALSEALPAGTNTESSNQPPRKRARLQNACKSAKRISHSNLSDSRFLVIVQQSIACSVVKRQAAGRSRVAGRSEQSLLLESQDRLLANRLRTYLLAQGFKETDVIELNDEDTVMAIDEGTGTLSPTSVGMDIDVEAVVPCNPNPTSPLCRSSLPGLDGLLNASNLVATLIMRHKCRKKNRSPTGSERHGIIRERTSRLSPLATADYS